MLDGLRVVASIEARMGSSRMPGKVLSDVGGVPALSRLLRRLRQCEMLDDIVLATSTATGDDALEEWASSEDVACFRGSEDDVLERVVGAQQSMNSDIVVEVTGDCILLDPGLIDMAVATFHANDCDVVTNVRMPGYPLGADFQVFPLTLLEEVERTIHDPAVREHVSLYFYENPDRYTIFQLMPPPRWRWPELRLQLDYAEDLAFICAVYDGLEPHYGDRFGLEEIMQLVRREPALPAINLHCDEKAVR
jgi:spore coat polysaccharide biosynthesis protein SpsF